MGPKDDTVSDCTRAMFCEWLAIEKFSEEVAIADHRMALKPNMLCSSREQSG